MDVDTGQARPAVTISMLTQHCRNRLHECASEEQNTESHWAQNRLSDFNVWDAGVGASARQSHSLEVRLRDDKTARKLVISALSTLKTWLELHIGCNKVSTEESNARRDLASSKVHVDRSKDISKAEAEQNIEQVFQVLIKLGIAIRQAGSPSHVRNADREFHRRKEEYKAFEAEMASRLIWKRTQMMLADGLDISVVQSRYEELQEEMQKRIDEGVMPHETQAIIEANARRRHRFRFAEKRANRLQADKTSMENLEDGDSKPTRANMLDSSPLADVSSVSRAQDSVARKRTSIGPQSDNISVQQSASRSKPSQSYTTKLSTHLPDNQISRVLEHDQPLAPPTVTTSKVDYPTAPKVDRDAAAFICPYCQLTLSKITGQGPRWVKHVSDDLRPYTCFLPDCTEMQPLFGTFQEWETHISSGHRSLSAWECILCDPVSLFTDRFLFTKHAQLQHKDELQGENFDDFIATCEILDRPTFTKCPICSIHEDEWFRRRVSDQHFDLQNSTFLKHIGVCMHQFSLLALPVRPDEDAEGQRSSALTGASNLDSRLSLSSVIFSDLEQGRPGFSNAEKSYIDMLKPVPFNEHKIEDWRAGVEATLPALADETSTPSTDRFNNFFPSADHLCQQCTSLGYKIRQLCEAADFTFTVSGAWVDRNRSTCAFCEMIFCDEGEGDYVIRSNTYLHRNTYGIDGLEILFRDIHGKQRLNELAVFTVDGSVPAISKQVSGRCIKPASNLDRTKDWLDDCLRTHDHVSNRAATGPSRLLAVGTADGSEPIKLVNFPDSDGKYIALSYLWGRTGINLKTTTEYLQSFYTSISWYTLPRTFQDAMEIARELSIGFVWIDALCIVQDSKQDLQDQAPKIADIFNGAFLTIMAASASDSHSGLFRERTKIKEMVALPYTDAMGVTKFSVFVSKPLQSFEEVLVDSKLFQRAWVFQERLMSRRKLIIGEDQTYWECKGVVLSESNIQLRDDMAVQHRQNNEKLGIFSDLSYMIDVTDNQKADLWATVVQEFSRRLLAYPSDRLSALSTIARTFAFGFGGNYIAGMWSDQMPYSLSWRVSHPVKDTREQGYCAPSWSWASIGGSISFPANDGTDELEVVDIEVEYAKEDSYGSVSSSSIRVRSRLRSGRLIRREEDMTTVHMETEDVGLRRLGFLDRCDRDLPAEVIFLQITSGKGSFDGSCLILEQRSDGYFRRVGMAKLDVDYDIFHGLPKEEITLV